MNQKSIKFDDFGPILLFEVQFPFVETYISLDVLKLYF